MVELNDLIKLGGYWLWQAAVQARGVLPVSACLLGFHRFIIGQDIPMLGTVLYGLVYVMLGLFLFQEGLRYGLMPIGELVGHQLPRSVPRWLLLTISIILGTVITLAEPSMGVLRILASSDLIVAKRAPYLWALLNGWPSLLSISVGLGAGLAAGVGSEQHPSNCNNNQRH